MFILWQICSKYVKLLQVVVHNVSALCNCINDVLYVARIKKTLITWKMTFVLEYYLLGSNPNACDAYILQYAYMHRYKNINIHIKNLQSY